MPLPSFDLHRILGLLVSVLLAGLAFASAAQGATVTIPGNPMTVFVGDFGTVTARFAGAGSNVFFSPADNDSPNAGFNLGFPVGFGAGPINYGVAGIDFTPVSQGPLTGAGTNANPYRVVTEYKVPIDTSTDAAFITQAVTYYNGQSRFFVTYVVRNDSGAPLRFRAGEFADLYLGDDSGTGIFRAGPPRLVGGFNAASGQSGGIEEVIDPWDRYQEGSYSTVSANLANLAGPGLTNTIDPSDVDNGVAVQWDRHFANGLGPSGQATFHTAWSFSRVPPRQPTIPAVVDNSIDAQLARLPAPRLGKTVNVAPVKGDVFVKLPARSSAASAAQKGRGFIPLRQARQIPVGSLLDTRKGTVRLVSAAARGKQQGDFNAGFFKAVQSRRGRGLTELRLAGGRFSRCGSRRGRGAAVQASRRSRRVVRRLRGNARGRFRTRGRYSSATVRGTDWTVTDRCDGTLTKVRRGSVVVRDLRRRKKVILKAGRSRLVRAPG